MADSSTAGLQSGDRGRVSPVLKCGGYLLSVRVVFSEGVRVFKDGLQALDLTRLDYPAHSHDVALQH